MACQFIGLAANSNVLDEVTECDRSGMLGNNNSIVRIPLIKQFALLDLLLISDKNDRTVRYIELTDSAIIVIENVNDTRTRKDNLFTFDIRNDFHSFILNRTVELR